MAKRRRTSNIVKYCKEHGRMVGFAWGGHRKNCKAGEVTEAEYLASIKAKGKGKAVRVQSVSLVLKPQAKAAVGSVAEKIVSDLKNRMFDFTTEIEGLEIQRGELHKKLEEVDHKLADSRGEKDELIRGLKELI